MSAPKQWETVDAAANDELWLNSDSEGASEQQLPVRSEESPEYTLRIELPRGKADPTRASMEWEPVSICILNCWPVRNLEDAVQVLEDAGYSMSVSEPLGICRIILPVHKSFARARGMMFLKVHNPANAAYMIEHLNDAVLTAPTEDRAAKRLHPTERVRYVIVIKPADKSSPREGRKGAMTLKAPGWE